MNEQWIDDLRAERVDTSPRPGFKDELRATLVAKYHGITTPSSPATIRHRRAWLAAAAAACVALLIGGLVVFGGTDRTLTPSTAPDPTTAPSPLTVPSTDGEPATSTIPDVSVPVVATVADLLVTDPQAISLDPWIDPAAMPALDPSIVAIDRETLPAGWTVSDEDGHLLVRPKELGGGYRYSASVTTDEQAVFNVTYTRDPLEGDPCWLVGSPGTVGDLTGATTGEAVCGETDEGYFLSAAPAANSATGSQWTALDVANAVSFELADDMPHLDLTTVEGDEEPDAVDFAGTLTGARWAVTVEPSGTRRTDLYVAGKLFAGFEGSHVELNSGQPISSIEHDLAGVPGYGAVAYGHVAGDAVAVIVTLDDGRTAKLPTSSADGRSGFAVPIPDSVHVDTLTFIAADESVLAVADVPDIPVGFAGGSLGLVPASATVVESDNEETALYGPPGKGFSVSGEPEGLRLTVVPLTETIGPVGEVIVSQRFTAKELDSQVTITRQSNIDVQRLLENFEAAKSMPEGGTLEVVIGQAQSPGYLYKDAGSGWDVVMWVVADDSAIWVLGSGLTGEELLNIAHRVEALK